MRSNGDRDFGLMTTQLTERIETILLEYPDAILGYAVSDLSESRNFSESHRGFAMEINGDRVFHAASTMKVPVMIELFRQVELDVFGFDDSLLVENSFTSIVDGSPYRMDIGEDSDESVYGEIGSDMSIRDLTYQMITMSSNLATNLLIDLVSADSVQKAIERLGTTTMNVRRGVEDIKAFELGLNNTATAADLATLFNALSRGEAVSDEADVEMIEILQNQKFGEMIPAGVPAGLDVAHKTGSITKINHDAGIVSPADKPFVLVILTEGLEDEKQAWELGRRVTAATWEVLRPNP